MGKLKALALLGTIGAAGYYAVNNMIHEGLISREIAMPESVSKLISEKGENPFEQIEKEYEQWLETQEIEEISRVNDKGYRLQAYLIRPEKESDVYVFASHGYRCNGKKEWARYVDFYVNQMGYNMFFIDHQAAGKSEGRYIGFSSFESRDGLDWLEFMLETFGEDIKIILHGISMGSATVMLMTGNEKLPENVKFTIADCGFTSALDEFTYKLESLKVPKFPIIPTVSAINKYKVGYDFGKDTNALEAVKKAKIPMLFVHGDADKFVPTYMGYILYHECMSEYKDLLIVEGAEHAQSYLVDMEGYQAKIKQFAEKFI